MKVSEKSNCCNAFKEGSAALGSHTEETMKLVGDVSADLQCKGISVSIAVPGSWRTLWTALDPFASDRDEV